MPRILFEHMDTALHMLGCMPKGIGERLAPRAGRSA